MNPASVPVIQPADLANEIEHKDVFLLDVREPAEAAVAVLPASVLVPLGQIPARLADIPKDANVVVYCHRGGRSAQAVAYLLANGYDNVRNLVGGIDAWSITVDPKVTRY